MARARNIKPGFFLNDDLAELEPLARLLFIGLWCVADREGRLEYRPKKIKAAVLPYDDCDIESLIQELCKYEFITVYTVDNIEYIQVVNFKKHQNPHLKEKGSTIPPPPSTGKAPCKHSASNGASTGNGCGDSGKEAISKIEKYSNGNGLNEHHASTVPAPEMHTTSRADSGFLIPDSGLLIPDSFNPESDTDISSDAAFYDEDFKRVVQAFDQNIHPITPMEGEKLSIWMKDVEADVIIAAIEEAVTYNKRSYGYINAVLNNWHKNNITTINGVKAYLRDRRDKQNGSDNSNTFENDQYADVKSIKFGS